MNFTKDKQSERYPADRFFFRIGRWIWIPVCIFGFWFAYGGGFFDYGNIFACTFKEATMLPCPGCGGTRAFYYFFRGEFITSIQMNVAVMYGALAYLHFMGLFIWHNYIQKQKHKEIPVQYYLIGAAVVIIGQWIVKLVMIFM